MVEYSLEALSDVRVRIAAATARRDAMIAVGVAADEAERRIWYPGWTIEKYRERMAHYAQEYEKVFCTERAQKEPFA